MNLNFTYSALSGFTEKVMVAFLSPISTLILLKIFDWITLTDAAAFLLVDFPRAFLRFRSIWYSPGVFGNVRLPV